MVQISTSPSTFFFIAQAPSRITTNPRGRVGSFLENMNLEPQLGPVNIQNPKTMIFLVKKVRLCGFIFKFLDSFVLSLASWTNPTSAWSLLLNCRFVPSRRMRLWTKRIVAPDQSSRIWLSGDWIERVRKTHSITSRRRTSMTHNDLSSTLRWWWWCCQFDRERERETWVCTFWKKKATAAY